MSYFRQKRIDLTDIDARFKDCFVMVGTKGFLEVSELRKQIARLNSRMEINDIKLNKLKSRLDEDEILKEYEERSEQDIKLSDELIQLYVQIGKGNFISGMIYDNEISQVREMTAQDIELFDNEILTRLVQAILGTVGKKA